jgi:hypothetical protein
VIIDTGKYKNITALIITDLLPYFTFGTRRSEL